MRMMVGGEQPEKDRGVCHENEMVSVPRLLMGAMEVTANGVLVIRIDDAIERSIICLSGSDLG